MNILVLPWISVLGRLFSIFLWCEHGFFYTSSLLTVNVVFSWNTGWAYSQRSSICKKLRANLWVFEQSALLAVLILEFLHGGGLVVRWEYFREAKVQLQLRYSFGYQLTLNIFLLRIEVIFYNCCVFEVECISIVWLRWAIGNPYDVFKSLRTRKEQYFSLCLRNFISFLSCWPAKKRETEKEGSQVWRGTECG